MRVASPTGMGDPHIGFIHELLDKLAKKANFTFVRVAIDNYPNSWGEGGGHYDMVAADLSVTEERERRTQRRWKKNQTNRRKKQLR